MIRSSQKNGLRRLGLLTGCMLVLGSFGGDCASAQDQDHDQYQDMDRYDAVIDSIDPEEGESLHGQCIPAPAIPGDEMTALQKHLAFFDRNSDAKVSVRETLGGLRMLGIPAVVALPAAISINGAMATPTAGYPTLTLHIRSIEAGIHGSDTGIYDDNGLFVPEKFEAWFKTWDQDGDGALNLKELAKRLYKEEDLYDFFGLIASGGEFGALYLVAAEDGKISKERMLGLYDGSLFYTLARARGILDCP